MKNNDKLIKKYRKNNEFYIEIINKIEKIKLLLLKKDNGKIFKKCFKFIMDNEDYYIMAKKDRRRLNREELEKLYYKIFKEEIDEKEFFNIIEHFHSFYYLSYNFVNKFFKENLTVDEIALKEITKFQMKNYQKVLYLNYPYIFKKITDFLKYNPQLKNHINDIENTTLSIVLNSIIKFQNQKNVKFVTYLGYWIKYGIEEEINFLNKNNQTKFNNLSNFRFSNSDFYDKTLKNKIIQNNDPEKHKKLKYQQKQFYKTIVNKIKEMNINFFEIFNIDIDNLTLSEFVNKLNYIITNKENRTLLYNYFTKPENNFFFKNHNITVNNNKTSLYRCLNLLLLNDFHYKTVPVYNIDEVSHNYLTFEIDYHEDDVFYKLKKYLTLEECKILDKFYNQEIDDLPEKLKQKITKLLKIDKNKNYIIEKEIS